MLPSPAEILEAVGYGLLLPAAVAVVGLLLALRLGGGEPLGVGAGLAAGFVALAATGQTDWEFLRPQEAWDWLPALGLLAAVAASVERVGLARWSGRIVVAALTTIALLVAQSRREPVPSYLFGAIPLAVLILWTVLDLAARRHPGGLLPALLTLVAFAAAALGEMAGFLTVAQLGGVVAGALAGWALVAWRRPRPGVCRAGVGPFAVLLPGVLFVAFFNSYSDVPVASYFLLLAAPFCLGATALLQLGPSALRRALILGAATGVPLAVALVLAARA
jgi:hypothetical protein